MSFNRMLSIALLSAMTLSASAHELSVGAGALSTTMFSKLTYSDDTSYDTQVTATATSISGELYFGYAYNINPGFDIGFELFYDLGGPEIESTIATPGYVKNDLSNTIGLRILPGFNITPSTRIYAGVGYAYMDSSIDIADTDTDLTFESSSASKKGGSIFYTAGLETMIYTSFGIRAAYSVIDAASAGASLSSLTTYSNGAHEKYKAKPAFNTFYLGGVFRFAFK